MDATYLNASSHNVPRAPTSTKLVGLHLTAPYPGVTWPGIPDPDPTLVLVVRSHETCTQFQFKAIAAADVPFLQKRMEIIALDTEHEKARAHLSSPLKLATLSDGRDKNTKLIKRVCLTEDIKFLAHQRLQNHKVEKIVIFVEV